MSDAPEGAVSTERVDRIPHDPIDMESRECPDCNEPWPCAERKRQRENKKWIDRSLNDALYRPTAEHVDIDGVEALRWQSPMQWSVDLTYGERGLVVVVHSYDGDHRSDNATPEWLLGVLP